VFAHRDREMALDEARSKGRALSELCRTMDRHRTEDLEQLSSARQQLWARWDERLKRLAEWSATAKALHQSSLEIKSLRAATVWFGRAPQIAERYVQQLENKSFRFEKELMELRERLGQWMDRLSLKEAEVKRFVENEAVKTTEILVSATRKRIHMDFVYNEKDEEARIARRFRLLRQRVYLIVRRLSRGEKWLPPIVETHAAVFEVRKKELLESWRPAEERYRQLEEAVLKWAGVFEEGRQRLRWIYETARQMRVVETTLRRRPLLERLFNLKPD
jgi:hypothetical protein